MEIQSVKYLLMVQDMDRAIAFYQDVIGLNLKSYSPEWSEFTLGDSTVALHGGGTGEFIETGLIFRVADIGSACQEVVSGGGKLRSGPVDRPGEPIKLAQLCDTESNGFTFSQYVG